MTLALSGLASMGAAEQVAGWAFKKSDLPGSDSQTSAQVSSADVATMPACQASPKSGFRHTSHTSFDDI